MAPLPPLNALRAFESAARCGGFVPAGQELGVSSAAVSLQVKNLETHVGKQLFLRSGNRIFLTDAGEAIYPSVAAALTQLTDATRLLERSQSKPQIVVSVLPSLSELWLMPKLDHLGDLSVEVRVENDPIDFNKSGVDLRLTYSARYYHEFHQAALYADVAVPCCSPAFWQSQVGGAGKVGDVPTHLFIANQWGPAYASEPTWEDWFTHLDPGDIPQISPALTFSDTAMAIAAARQGLGIALAPKALLAKDLAAGDLIIPWAHQMPMRQRYFAICPQAKRNASAIRRFLALLAP